MSARFRDGGRPRSSTRAGGLLALLVGLAGVGVVAPPAPAATVLEGAVTVTVAPAASGRLAPGQDLALEYTITNDSASTLPPATAEVLLDRTPLTTSASLDEWLAPEDPLALPEAATVVDSRPLPALPPGASTDPIAVTVPAAAVALTAQSAFGARGLAVRLVADGEATALGRGALVFEPGVAPPEPGVAVVMPLTVPGRASGLIPAAELEAFTAGGGVLSRQLNSVLGTPVAIAVDPMIIASVRALGTAAPPSAVGWLERLRLADNETFALPYADQDLSALAQAGSPSLGPTSFAGLVDGSALEQPTASPTPEPDASADPEPDTDPEPQPVAPTVDELTAWQHSLPPIAWPAADSVVAADLPLLAAAGPTATILSAGNVERAGAASVSAVSASAVVGEQPVLVAASTASRLLDEAAHAADAVGFASATARLSAAVAVLADESGAGSAVPLLALDRSWPVSSFRVGEAVQALLDTPWAQPATLATALAQPPSPVTVIDRPQSADRIEAVRALVAADGADAEFSLVAADPLAVTAERRLALLALLSVDWRPEPAAWREAVDAFLTASVELRRSVAVVEPSPLRLGNVVALPIDIRNDLAVPADVVVTVTSNRPQLVVIDETLEQSLPAQSVTSLDVGVRTVGDGPATVTVTLFTRDGRQLGEPQRIPIDVQASWETAGVAVIGVLAGLLFVIGLVRSVRRIRGRREIAATGDGSDG